VNAFPRVASLKSAMAFRAHLERSSIPLEFDDTLTAAGESPLAQPFTAGGVRVGNRFCILPMEGWDGTAAGAPSELTRRRWRHFGNSGAKLIWGGEAVAVRQDGRANPHQLMMCAATERDIALLRQELIAAHRERFGANADADLWIGLQLTHSGRYARPHVFDHPEPLAGAHHPVLDRRFPRGVRVLTDDELDRLVIDFIAAARSAYNGGYQFIDVKACHGYLGHELLGARGRSGQYGGSLENRMRFMRQIIEGIRTEVPGLDVVVRLSAFDTVPYLKRPDGLGAPEIVPGGDGEFGFGVISDDSALDEALEEPRAVLRMLERLDVKWVCVSGGSPYYNPHVQRPAMFPPLDGYDPPEDPLRGVARQIAITARLKRACPNLAIVGSGYSYLQEWLPNVAQHTVRTGMTDLVGLGRMVLAYPDLPDDILEGRPLRRASICRTFSDCTTGPRLGLVSGCYPLDRFYSSRPEAIQVKNVRAHDIQGASR
jgi:2,4-dienoyl-CoA reductase-like NADH-dependent reductase (Old Yellow Enzyme family)